MRNTHLLEIILVLCNSGLKTKIIRLNDKNGVFRMSFASISAQRARGSLVFALAKQPLTLTLTLKNKKKIK